MRQGAAAVLMMVLAAGVCTAQEPDSLITNAWIAAVRLHQPGTIDAPLTQIAEWSASVLGDVHRQLLGTVDEGLQEPEDRADVLRRGVLVHTDIALLLPERAASFTKFPGGHASIASGGWDGRFQTLQAVTALGVRD